MSGPQFLEILDISYYATVRGPDILRNVIVSGYVTFNQFNKFSVNMIFFHYWQNDFAVGRSLETPVLGDTSGLLLRRW